MLCHVAVISTLPVGAFRINDHFWYIAVWRCTRSPKEACDWRPMNFTYVKFMLGHVAVISTLPVGVFRLNDHFRYIAVWRCTPSLKEAWDWRPMNFTYVK